jgi:hypothetical protein
MNNHVQSCVTYLISIMPLQLLYMQNIWILLLKIFYDPFTFRIPDFKILGPPFMPYSKMRLKSMSHLPVLHRSLIKYITGATTLHSARWICGASTLFLTLALFWIRNTGVFSSLKKGEKYTVARFGFI